MRIIGLAIALILALACNIEYHWRQGLPHGGFSSFDFPGPVAGMLICAIIGAVVLYRAFLVIQDILVANRLMPERVSTTYDYLPMLLIVPFMIGYSFQESGNTTLQWGAPMHWYFFAAILCTIFLYQMLCVCRSILRHTETRRFYEAPASFR